MISESSRFRFTLWVCVFLNICKSFLYLCKTNFIVINILPTNCLIKYLNLSPIWKVIYIYIFTINKSSHTYFLGQLNIKKTFWECGEVLKMSYQFTTAIYFNCVTTDVITSYQCWNIIFLLQQCLLIFFYSLTNWFQYSCDILHSTHYVATTFISSHRLISVS